MGISVSQNPLNYELDAIPFEHQGGVTMDVRVQRTVALGLVVGIGASLLVAVMLGLQPAQYAQAANLDVCPSGCPYTTIQDAVNAAGDSDIIRVVQGTYTSTIGTVAVITKSVRLQGGWDSNSFNTRDPTSYPTVLDGQWLGPVILVTSPITTTPIAPTIDGFIVTRGMGQLIGCPPGWTDSQCGGGISSLYANPIIANNVITSNLGGNGRESWGGGIFLFHSTSTTVISHNLIVGNVANTGGLGVGGGLAVYSGDAMIANNQIMSNTGSTVGRGTGGGLYHNSGRLTIQNNTVQFNVASAVSYASGGGVSLWASQAALISNTIVHNGAGSADDFSVGGGVRIGSSDVTITGNMIAYNHSSGQGGGIHELYGGIATIANNQVLSNSAEVEGGGIWIGSAASVISNVIAYNRAITPSQSYGGGIYVRDGPVTVTNNQIHHNSVAVDSGGAGIYLGGSNTTALIQYNDMLYNSGGDGGGIWPCGVATVTVDSNLIAYNVTYVSWGSAARYCSAQAVSTTLSNNIIVSNTGNGVSTMQNVRVVNNTIAHNSQSGLDVGLSAAPFVINNISVGNGSCGFDGSGYGIQVLDYNDSWGNSSNYCNANPGSHDISVDPQFVNATAGDYHIRFGSPAMNAGTNDGAPAYDKDGVPRPQGSRVDIGAYEAIIPYSVYLPVTLKN
jgi:hypothetical protein